MALWTSSHCSLPSFDFYLNGRVISRSHDFYQYKCSTSLSILFQHDLDTSFVSITTLDDRHGMNRENGHMSKAHGCRLLLRPSSSSVYSLTCMCTVMIRPTSCPVLSGLPSPYIVLALCAAYPRSEIMLAASLLVALALRLSQR